MELSPREKRRIQKLSIIPAAIVTYFLFAFFIYQMRSQQPSLTYSLVYFVAVLAIAVPMTMLVTEEVLYSRKVKKQRPFHVKRVLGRFAIVLGGATAFLGIFSVTQFALISWLGERNVLLLSGGLWLIVWAFAVILLKDKLQRLYDG